MQRLQKTCIMENFKIIQKSRDYGNDSPRVAISQMQ